MTSRARSVADAYFAAVNAKDLERVVSLFSSSGRVVNDAGVFEGRDGIRAWYTRALLTDFVLKPTQVHDAGSSCVVEFDVVGPGSTRRFLDVIEIDEDCGITRLQYFSSTASS